MDFVQTMKDWRRMCNANMDNCDKCPLASYECCSTPKNRRYFTDEQVEGIVMAWAAENPEPVYPTWGEVLVRLGVLKKGWEHTYAVGGECLLEAMAKCIDTETAMKLGIEPKEG